MRDARNDLGKGKRELGTIGATMSLLASLAAAGCGPAEPGRPADPPPAAPAAPTSAGPSASRPAVTGPTSGWFQEVQTRIQASEYRIREEGRQLTAANRQHRLRAIWQEDGLAISTLAAAPSKAAVSVRSVALGRGGATSSLAGGRFRIGQCRGDGALDEKGACLRRLERDAGGAIEWWENRPGGLEQGFVIPRAPRATGGGADWLRIEVQVTGARTELAEGSSRAVLTARDGRRFHYAGLVAEDATGRDLPTRMRQGPRGIFLEIDDAGARYPVLVDPVLTAAEWTVESNLAAAGTGMTVSGAGDVNDDGLDDVLVAYPEYNGAGQVFLYLGDAAGLDETAAWSSQGTNAGGTPAATAGSRFGSAATAAGDVDGDDIADVIIGQSNWSNGEAAEGRAYVFLGGLPAGLPATPVWVVEGNVAGGLFGAAASGAGDLNADGFDDVIVGAPSTAGAGRIQTYLGSDTGPSTTASDTITGTAGHRLGAVVASAGDVNGDGRADVVVAATLYGNGEANEGAAFAYLGAANGTLTRPGAFAAGTTDHFETNEGGAQVDSVAGLGDLDGDGYADVAVGSANKGGEGVVYVFKGAAGGLAPGPTIIESNVAGAEFGSRVAGPGDVNGDGHADLAVGAPGLDNGATANAGAVYLIPGSGRGPAFTDASLADSVVRGTLANQSLGGALGAAGDVNNDGYGDVVAGSPGLSNGQTNEGRAHLLLGSANTNGLRRASDLAIEANTAGAGLGLAVAGAGDTNGDGFGDLAVAAPSFGGANNGRVFLYLGGANGPDTTADGTLIGPTGAGFGEALARAGDVNGDGFGDLLVGAPNFSDGQADEGRIYLYPGASGGITAATTPVTFDSDVAGALLGTAVGASDTNGDGLHDVLAGAPGLANGQPGEGRVYLLRGSPGGLITASPATVESDLANARFGVAVAGAGDVNNDGRGDVVVGAPGFNGGQGRIYVYFGQAAGLAAPIIRDGDEAAAEFGAAVDTAGDVDSDGFADVAAGAPGTNGGAGTVYVYEGGATTIVDVPYSYASAVDGARLGSSLAGGLDLDHDAIADVVVGAPAYSNGQTNEGAVYVFLSGGTPLPGAVSQIIEGGVANLALGSAVANAGDVNGDGVTDAILGAPGFSGGEAGEGRALLHLGNTNGRPFRLRALRPSSSTIVQPGNVVAASVNAFDIAILASGPLGITRVKLETEVKPRGTDFDDNDTVIDADFTSSGLTGIAMTRRVTGLSGSTSYHFRARLEYDPTQRTLRGRHSPWFYGSHAETLGTHLRTDGVGGGTPCTMASQCGVAGFCVDGVCCNEACGGGVTTDCRACSAAAGGTMADGTCSARTVGLACNDSSMCTSPDACQAGGVCSGTSAVTCPTPDQCHNAGVCNPATGVCSNPAKTDGTACQDGNMCTQPDVCTTGVCTAGAARSCDDSDPCTTDSCVMATGCVNVIIAGCVVSDGGATDGPVSDGSAGDGPVTDGATGGDGPGGDSGDALAATDGRLDGAGSDGRLDGPAGSDARRDGAVDAAIRRGGGGGGCDCDVGRNRPSEAMQASVPIGLALVLFFRRRRRRR